MGHIILGDYRHQQSRKSSTMFSLLLLLPGLLTAATLTKHLKAPSPIYTPPVYSEYNGHHGHGLGYGHGHNGAYNQGFANGGYVTPVKPGHVFTGYPSYSQGHHAAHHPVHASTTQCTRSATQLASTQAATTSTTPVSGCPTTPPRPIPRLTL